MRTLIQPGPRHPRRIDCTGGTLRRLDVPLEAGASLNHALAGPIAAAGMQAAAITFSDVALHPFAYVIPAKAEDASHVAYFSAPRACAGPVRVEQANASFGWSDGLPFIHCHAVWQTTDGRRGGGHILPHEAFLQADAVATAWGFSTIRLEALPDAETNFRLFQPAALADDRGHAVLARVKPNEDIVTAVETLARARGLQDAAVLGSLGSLIGVRFRDGRGVDDVATEVFVRHGEVRGGSARLNVAAVDMAGLVHEGWLEHGRNPVCITFDVVLTGDPAMAARQGAATRSCNN